MVPLEKYGRKHFTGYTYNDYDYANDVQDRKVHQTKYL